MTDARLHVQIDTLEDMGERFAAAWKAAEAGREPARDHATSSVSKSSRRRCRRAGSN
ncbi:MAG: hypothetical protein ACXW27_10660 [Allosphingosinicella sp.]